MFVVAALATGRLSAANLAMAVPTARPAHAGGALAAAGAFAIALVQVSYAYSGWNGAAYIAGEVRDPVRALPRALVLGTGLVTVLYLALNVVYLCAVPPAALAGQINVGHIAAGALFGARGADVVSSLIALTNAGFVSAMVMSGPRVAVAMGEDGAFFRALGRTNARGAPARAVAPAGGARDRRGVDREVRPDPGLRRLHADAERGRRRARGVRAAAARPGGRPAAQRARLAVLGRAVPGAGGVHDRARGPRAAGGERGRAGDAGRGRRRVCGLASPASSDMMSSPR